MPDPLAQELMRLAPEVDVPAARDVFERSRTGGRSGGPRWLLPAAVVVLVVAGITGIWAVAGDDGSTSRVGPVDESDESAVTEGTVTEGDGYEVVFVSESSFAEVYGSSYLVTTEDRLGELWDDVNPGQEQPTIDFASHVALITLRPDNACPDALTRFDVVPGASGVPAWTPVFEELATACDDPLLSWTYVVAIDRAALGPAATFVVPAEHPDIEMPDQVLEYTSVTPSATASSDEADEPVLTATGVTAPLPPVGEPTIHNTSIGLIWVVAHDDGSVSVLPATVDRPPTEDEGGVTMLQSLVQASESGDAFAGGPSLFVWDAHGRSGFGGHDLVGYAGRVDGDQVEIMLSTTTRVEGEFDDTDRPGSGTFGPPRLGELIDLATFASLSSSGPIWRHLNATLVVENGIGRICELPPDPTFDQLTGCDQSESEFVFDTQVTATDPDVTSWFHAPILAFQDPVDGFTSVIPMGGMTSRNDAAVE